MSCQRGWRRGLDGIGRDLADSDPRLGELFTYFNEHADGGRMPATERIRTGLPGLLRRLGRRMRPVAADFDRPAAWWL